MVLAALLPPKLDNNKKCKRTLVRHQDRSSGKPERSSALAEAFGIVALLRLGGLGAPDELQPASEVPPG